MLTKAYEALMNGWTVTNTVTGHAIGLTPGHLT
jgi:hypothetical protein